MVTRTRLNVTLYVHCLSYFMFYSHPKKAAVLLISFHVWNSHRPPSLLPETPSCTCQASSLVRHVQKARHQILTAPNVTKLDQHTRSDKSPCVLCVLHMEYSHLSLFAGLGCKTPPPPHLLPGRTIYRPTEKRCFGIFGVFPFSAVTLWWEVLLFRFNSWTPGGVPRRPVGVVEKFWWSYP